MRRALDVARPTDARLVAAVTAALSHSSGPREPRAPRSYVWIVAYIGPVPAKGPVRALLIRRGERVFIKRGPGADSYDAVVRVYSFPREAAADIYTVGLPFLPSCPSAAESSPRKEEGGSTELEAPGRASASRSSILIIKFSVMSQFWRTRPNRERQNHCRPPQWLPDSKIDSSAIDQSRQGLVSGSDSSAEPSAESEQSRGHHAERHARRDPHWPGPEISSRGIFSARCVPHPAILAISIKRRYRRQLIYDPMIAFVARNKRSVSRS